MTPIQDIANKVYQVIKGYNISPKAYIGAEKDVLRVSLDEDISIVLIYNDRLKQWVLIAERDVTHLPEITRAQLLERLMDTASHSRFEEYLVVGLTASRKISVSKNLVDVSVNKGIINTIERIVAVVMNNDQAEIIESSSIMHC